ncbi:MAG: CBS domain-containing protein [Amphritea sp.]
MFQEFYPIRLNDICEVEHMLSPDVSSYNTTLRSSAVEVMTDFSVITPVTVAENVQIDDALERMKRQHVRMLFVTTDVGKLLGVITARDILGSKVMVYMTGHGIDRSEVTVRNIMLDKLHLRSLTFEQIELAKIGDVMLTLKTSGDQHVLVVDQGEAGIKRIRGIISASDISRKLKVGFDVMYEAKSFAEIEKIVTQGGEL